jgi:hypothetical protein
VKTRYAAMFDRDPDREEADGAGADHRVGDEPRKRVADPALVVAAQTHHLARDQQVHASQMMLIEKNSAAIHDIEERRGQQAIDRNVPCRCQVSAKTASA